MKSLTISIILSILFASVSAQDVEKKMTEAATNAYKMLLKETDKNKDGKISKAEFFAIWKDKKVAADKFKYWDTNKDGYITQSEYVKAAVAIGKKKK